MKRRGAFYFYFTAGACLLLLPLKMIKGWNSEEHCPLFSSWVADACFLFWLYWLGVKAGGDGPVRRPLVGGLVFFGVELPALAVIASHTYFLEEATARQFSLLDVSPEAASFFLREVVPLPALLSAVGAAAALAVAACVLQRLFSPPPDRPLLWSLAALTALVLIHQALCDFYPSVLWEAGRDAIEAFSHPAVNGSRYSAELADAAVGRPARWGEAPVFDKIFVFLMESVPLRELQERMRELPAENFFNRNLSHAHVYLNYFAVNQDSRTGMLAMLFGLIPFEAYAERDARRYLFLKNQRSLVNRLSALGYFTAVAGSQTDEELVVFELPWNKQITLSQAEFNNHGSFLCFNPFEFEHDCEDKILLPRLVNELSAHPRVFIFQEGVFGHIGDYSDRTGKTAPEYFGEHLQSLVDRLQARGELNRTLLVVTSDHGIRDADYRTLRWVYRLPLIFINPRFSHREETGLYNQSDFPALLAAELSDRSPPAPRRLSPFVGCSNSSVIGSVTAEGDLLVVKNRKWRRYVLAEGHCSSDNAPDSPVRHPIEAAALIDFFASQQAEFTPASLARSGREL